MGDPLRSRASHRVSFVFPILPFILFNFVHFLLLLVEEITWFHDSNPCTVKLIL